MSHELQLTDIVTAYLPGALGRRRESHTGCQDLIEGFKHCPVVLVDEARPLNTGE